MSTGLMTNIETFIETMREDAVFGIVGSAFMDTMGVFPQARIRFLSVAHEAECCSHV